MNLSDQKLNEVLKQIIDAYSAKGSISTNSLCDIMEKYETTPTQMDFVYKSVAEAGIQIIDEAERDKELYEQALRYGLLALDGRNVADVDFEGF